MQVRCIIFDVYGTLLEVGPAPADAETRWSALWQDYFHTPPRLERLAFSVACNQVIARHHAESRSRGIQWPEVCWPAIVAEVVPELRALTTADQEEFIYRQIQTGHSVRINSETTAALRLLAKRNYLLGLASNAQAYTVREFNSALAAHGLGLSLFEQELCFWSYQHGFSKPDPYVFQILSTRLALRGIPEAETLLVGDRLDNDIGPARKHGWKGWLFSGPGQHARDSGWRQLLAALDAKL